METQHSKPLKYFIIDAFTSKPFAGNPAAVCVLKEDKPDSWLQAVARETNVSDTAFVRPKSKEKNCFYLRWYTLGGEVDLCGHATVATAFVLSHLSLVSPRATIIFETKKSGIVKASFTQGGYIQLDFPAVHQQPASPDVCDVVVSALNLQEKPLFIGIATDILVELQSEDMVKNIKPNLQAIETKLSNARGVVVTARASASSSSSSHDIACRCFFPRLGIPEDPVTGSAHCQLAPYWLEKLGKSEFVSFQASQRGGFLRVYVEGERVKISGQAALVMAGELVC